jgi:hypothetical protein
MLEDLLRQRGICARLEGAGLQSGVGELPAIGLVRLKVDDDDFEAARAVIEEWERTAVPDPTPAPARRGGGALVGAAVGLVLGIGAGAWYFRVPVQVDGIDHNGDGILDERWKSSSSGALVRSEIDRNFDGEVDLVWTFDRNGQVESGVSDDDFNGSFESSFRFRDSQVYLALVDTDGDGTPDLKSFSRSGVLTRQEHQPAGSNRPVRVETFRLGRLVSADVDTDRDGELDRRYTYDLSGGETSERAIKASQ